MSVLPPSHARHRRQSARKAATGRLGVNLQLRGLFLFARRHRCALRDCRVTYSMSTLSIRDCHPSPVALKYAKTSWL